jgi:hypothetical protein
MADLLKLIWYAVTGLLRSSRKNATVLHRLRRLTGTALEFDDAC